MSYIVPKDKPKSCKYCRFLDRITYECELSKEDYADFKEQYEHCPLVEVPPHGRLIDAELMEEILTTAIRTMKGVAEFLSIEDDSEIKMEIKAYTDILNGVKEQPTIIGAEGSEDEQER